MNSPEQRWNDINETKRDADDFWAAVRRRSRMDGNQSGIIADASGPE
jgi:hypothetical protein